MPLTYNTTGLTETIHDRSIDYHLNATSFDKGWRYIWIVRWPTGHGLENRLDIKLNMTEYWVDTTDMTQQDYMHKVL